MTTTETAAGVLPEMADVPARELRVAVLGVGMMGADHVARLHSRISGAEVVVVSDAFTEKAEQVAAEVPGCRVVADPLAAIADSDVDAVVIASPGQFHEAQVLACIERGIPVLCEKPLTMDAESSLALVRAEDDYAARTGRRLVQVGFMRRFDPEYAQLRALIVSGQIGEPLVVHCAHRNAAVPPHFTSEMMISDSVVHEVDVARFLLDEEIAAVTVLRPKATRHAVAGQSDPLLVLFEMTSGRIVDVECFVSTGVAYEVRTEVVAEDGSAMIGLDAGLLRQTTGPDGAVRGHRMAPDFRERFGRAYDIQVQRWVDAARRGTIDGPGVWDGYAASAACTAGVAALRSGQRTEVGLAQRGGHPVVRIALDPQMLRTTPLLELPDVVAEMGYEWIELSPRDDFIPFFKHPRVDLATVRAFRSKLADAGVGVTSLLPVMRWSGPGEDERQAAVRYWRRAIEVCAELGVDTMNSEFNGRPEAPELAEAMFWRSMEELLPVFEREGIRLALEPHPDDFIELGHPAVDMVRGIDSPSVSFLYCLPHTFHQGDDAPGIIAQAGDLLTHVHVADSMDHTASDGLRYITNPPGNPIRVHQHAEIGRGDVDFDEAFTALAGIGFDGVLTTCVFGWDDQARESGVRMLAAIRELVTKHFPDDTTP